MQRFISVMGSDSISEVKRGSASPSAIKSRTYKYVNVENATLDNVYAFGQALAALSDWPLDQVILSSDQEIIDLP